MGAAAGARSRQVGGERRLPQKSVGPCPARISQTTDGRGGAKKAGIGSVDSLGHAAHCLIGCCRHLKGRIAGGGRRERGTPSSTQCETRLGDGAAHKSLVQPHQSRLWNRELGPSAQGRARKAKEEEGKNWSRQLLTGRGISPDTSGPVCSLGACTHHSSSSPFHPRHQSRLARYKLFSHLSVHDQVTPVSVFERPASLVCPSTCPPLPTYVPR